MRIRINDNWCFPSTASFLSQSRSYAAPLFFFFVQLLSLSICFAQSNLANLDEKLDATKRKEISITDFVSFLESEAETGELSRPFIEKSFAELPDLGTSLAETLDGKVETLLNPSLTTSLLSLGLYLHLSTVRKMVLKILLTYFFHTLSYLPASNTTSVQDKKQCCSS